MPEGLRHYLDYNVELNEEDKTYLPLFHICRRKDLMDYLREEKIQATEICDVLEKKIIYTFYGASKYITSETLNAESIGDHSVCLIFNTEHCHNILSIYPFDSGAASGKVKGVRPYPISWEKLKKEFDLGDRITRINRFILHCFMTLEDYISGIYKVTVPGTLDAKYPAPETVSQIIDMPKIITDYKRTDDRSYCVEVLFEDILEFTPDVIKGVIASKELLEKEDYLALIGKYRVEKDYLLEHSLYYPSSATVMNRDLEIGIKQRTIEFSKKLR